MTRTLKVKELNLGKYFPFLRGPGIGAWKWEKPLPLQSDSGILRIVFLGSGSAFSNRQYQSNFIVIKGKTAVFVDLGSKVSIKLLEIGLLVNDIKNIIITHSHADHIGSLEEVGLKARFQYTFNRAKSEGFVPGTGAFNKRVGEIKDGKETLPDLHVPYGYACCLWEKSLMGGMGYSETTTTGGSTQPMGPDNFFNLKPPRKIFNERYGRDTWECVIGEGKNTIHFLLYRTKHIPDTTRGIEENFFSCGMIIDEEVMVSGDTQFDMEVFTRIGDKCGTIFHDCQSFQGGVHAYYGDLCSLPEEVRRNMFLYHCDDGMRPLKDDGITLGGDERVIDDGFAGFAKPVPFIYEWE